MTAEISSDSKPSDACCPSPRLESLRAGFTWCRSCCTLFEPDPYPEGVIVCPVAGPTGTPPELLIVSAPYFRRPKKVQSRDRTIDSRADERSSEMNDHTRESLRHALGLFLAELRSHPSPDLHAVILDSPFIDHPKLFPGAGLPELPVNLRGKKWVNAYFIPLDPACKIHFFGDGERLGKFRDLSRVALAATRQAFPWVDELVRDILFKGPQRDADHILADLPLLLMRDFVDSSPDRRFQYERWYWMADDANLRVPYYADERRAIGLGDQASAEVNVTIFTGNVFSFMATALDFISAPSEVDLHKLSSWSDRKTRSLPEAPSDEFPEYVTLDQAAGMVHRSKRTLERYKTKGTLPTPTVDGGGGRPDLWEWKTIRPWLETTFNIKLPEHHPARRRS